MDHPSNNPIARRTMLAGTAYASAGMLLTACGSKPVAPAEDKTMLTIYSPAPPTNPMHKLNQLLGGAATETSVLSPMEIPPLALPQSINDISSKPADERAYFWPIITTVDFAPARAGAGPDWHGYPRACPDLKFVSRLYDVGFGIALWGDPITDPQRLRGKRIAAPPRPSAVRLMTEVLLRDGWGILDDVILVDMVPPDIAKAKAAGEIDGTSWNLAMPGEQGHSPMFPANPQAPLHYVPVDAVTLVRINAANPFTLALSPLLKDTPPLLSFAQALAVWDESDPAQIAAMLEYIANTGATLPGFPKSVQEMATWPGLDADAMHPVAAAFYKANTVQLSP